MLSENGICNFIRQIHFCVDFTWNDPFSSFLSDAETVLPEDLCEEFLVEPSSILASVLLVSRAL